MLLRCGGAEVFRAAPAVVVTFATPQQDGAAGRETTGHGTREGGDARTLQALLCRILFMYVYIYIYIYIYIERIKQKRSGELLRSKSVESGKSLKVVC